VLGVYEPSRILKPMLAQSGVKLAYAFLMFNNDMQIDLIDVPIVSTGGGGKSAIAAGVVDS
jgi:hypothetical protein